MHVNMSIKYYFSLTTIPTRVAHLESTLSSLMNQTIRPTRIFLYASESYKRFPDHSLDRDHLRKLEQMFEPVLSVRLMHDHGPVNKVLGIAFEPEVESHDLVVYVDDDRVYDTNMVRKFLETRAQLKNLYTGVYPVIGGSGQVMDRTYTYLGKPAQYPGYTNVLEGCNGVMVEKRYIQPNMLLELLDDGCRYVDDECLSAMYTKQHLDCYAMGCPNSPFSHSNNVDTLTSLEGDLSRKTQMEYAISRIRSLWQIWDNSFPVGMARYSTKYGDLFIWCNDVYIIDSLKQGRVFEEFMVVNYLRPVIEKASVILDIGAHIGCHSLLYHRINPHAVIYAFEPQRSVFECLKRNVEWNELGDRVNIYHKALGHKVMDDAHLSKRITDGPNTQSDLCYGSQAPDFNLGGLALGKDGEQVEMITIDSLHLDKVDYIKMDVEGFEPLVMLGGMQTILRDLPVILFEKNHKVITDDMVEQYGLSQEQRHMDSMIVLQKLGYQIIDLFSDNYVGIHASKLGQYR